MDFIGRIGGFVFGSECVGCGLPSERLDPWLCPDCVAELSREMKGYSCPRDDVFCLFPMRPLTRKLVHGLKYKGIPGLATYLVRRSAAVNGMAIGAELRLLPQPLFFVPVPLHPARYRERGYNQAERIAAALASVVGGRVCRWLRRKSFVTSQTKLSKDEREQNVMGAFESRLPNSMPGSGTIVVVDDVYTTGATTSACLDALVGATGLTLRVCTLLYDEPSTAAADFAADCRMDWDYG